MSDNIKIGDREYTPPFTGAYAPQGAHVPIDSTGEVVQIQDDFAALNELASLRQEREELKKEIDEAHGYVAILLATYHNNRLFNPEHVEAWLQRNKQKEAK